MLKRFKLTALLAIVILILSLASLGSVPKIDVKASDKIGHFLAYLALTSVFLFEYSRYTRWSTRSGRWLIYSILGLTAYGIVIEFLQASPIANRHFEYFDMIANFTGVVVASLLFIGLFPVIKERFQK